MTDDDSGVHKCNSPRCKLCEIIITGKNYYFRNCQVNFNLKASMDCDVKNCIKFLVLECVGCTKYYIGETNNYRLRTNLNRDHI